MARAGSRWPCNRPEQARAQATSPSLPAEAVMRALSSLPTLSALSPVAAGDPGEPHEFAFGAEDFERCAG